MIYLIEELWYDPMENRVAYGYDSIGYVETKLTAESLIEFKGVVSKDRCWQFDQDMPWYRFKEIKLLTIDR